VLRDGHLITSVKAEDMTEETLLALCYGELSNDNRAKRD